MKRLITLLTLLTLTFALRAKTTFSCSELLEKLVSERQPIFLVDAIKSLHFLDSEQLEGSGWDFLTNYYKLLLTRKLKAEHHKGEISLILIDSYQAITHDPRLSEKTASDALGLLLSTIIYGQKERLYYLSDPIIKAHVETIESYLLNYGKKGVNPFWTSYADAVSKRLDGHTESYEDFEMIFHYRFSLFKEVVKMAAFNNQSETLYETIGSTSIATLLNATFSGPITYQSFVNFLYFWANETQTLIKRRSATFDPKLSPLILIETMFKTANMEKLAIDESEKEALLDELIYFCGNFYPQREVPREVIVGLMRLL